MQNEMFASIRKIKALSDFKKSVDQFKNDYFDLSTEILGHLDNASSE